MTDEDSIERKVDEVLERFEISDEHIERRKPQQPSFRYLSPDESKVELEKETIENVSVMTKSGTPMVKVDDVFVLGMGGDLNAIENIIKKHQETRKFKEK